MNSSSFLFATVGSWLALAQSSGQSNLVVLFVDQDLANLFAIGIFKLTPRMADWLAIIANGFSFFFEIELQHLFCMFRRPDAVGLHGWHTPKTISLLSDDQCVVQFLHSLLFKPACDVQELSTPEDLRIDDVSDDRRYSRANS
jgi:hypothetical protein